MRKIEASWDSEEQNEEPERPTCLRLFEDKVYKLGKRMKGIRSRYKYVKLGNLRIQLQLQSKDSESLKATAKRRGKPCQASEPAVVQFL